MERDLEDNLMEDFNYFRVPPQKRCFQEEFIWGNHIKI